MMSLINCPYLTSGLPPLMAASICSGVAFAGTVAKVVELRFEVDPAGQQVRQMA